MCKLHKALLSAQAEMKMPKLDGVGNFKNKFASLGATRDAIVPALNKHGIAVVQGFVPTEGGIGVTTRLIHQDGEILDCGVFVIPVAHQDAQKYCSATTYARRFALQAAVCAVGEEDNDGHGLAEKPQSKQTPVSTEKSPKFKFLDDMKRAKAFLGDEMYYQILGNNGFEKANEISKQKDRDAVMGEMKLAAEAKKAMDA